MISRLRAAEHRTCHAGVIMLKICTRRSISALLAACLAQNLERSTSLAPSAILGPLHVHGRDRRVAGVLTSVDAMPAPLASSGHPLSRPSAALKVWCGAPLDGRWPGLAHTIYASADVPLASRAVAGPTLSKACTWWVQSAVMLTDP